MSPPPLSSLSPSTSSSSLSSSLHSSSCPSLLSMLSFLCLPSLSSLLFLLFFLAPPSSSLVVASSDSKDPLGMPNQASSLSCDELSSGTSSLPFNHTILCYIQCNHNFQEVAAAPEAFDFSVEAVTSSTPSHTPSLISPYDPSTMTTSVSFGSIEFVTVNESHVIVFRYTTPTEGKTGVIRILLSTGTGVGQGPEIQGSPLLFTLYDKDPPAVAGTSTSSVGFFRLDNPAMWAISAMAGVLAVVGLVGGVWSYRVFKRKEEEVRQRRERDEQWTHSVPSLNSRIDGGALRTPFLQ